MHPAPSIIVFTTSSGLGYGLLFLLAIGNALGWIAPDPWLGVLGLGAALAFITIGLVSSTLHLGHPERAWRAMSQWRSSWLSREAVLALVTYPLALGLAIGWIVFEASGGLFAFIAWLTALGALLTVACTGMIYASLKPIPSWHQRWTVPAYLGFALMSGALALHLLLIVFDRESAGAGLLAMLATLMAFGLKSLWWRRVDTDPPIASAESATGLGEFGLVRMLDPPHTQTNYLLHEMGFRIGRKHAQRIRALIFIFGLVLCLASTALALVTSGWAASILSLLALVMGGITILLERWLFFAEARHTVMLYYGQQEAA